MNGAGLHIGKILRRFTRQIFPTIKATAGTMTRMDAEWCLWEAEAYPEALESLVKLPEFKNAARADAYICGYYRGLKMAVYLLLKRKRRAA